MADLVLYIASSIDGFIAGENGDMSFLDKVHLEGEDYGYFDFYASAETIIIGRKTFEWVYNQINRVVKGLHFEKDILHASPWEHGEAISGLMHWNYVSYLRHTSFRNLAC